MNYTALSAAIQDYTENSESLFVSQIPTFVQQAEQRIYNTVQFPALRKNVTGGATTDNRYLACPNDFLAPYSMAVIEGFGTPTETYTYLLNKDVNFLRESFPSPLDTGLPAYYALFGPRSDSSTELSFILGPTPDADYTMELHYFFYPESITTTASGTSWLGDNIDSVLLYGALVEAYTFMKGEADIMAFYEKKYQDALGLAKRLGDGMERQDSYRSGQARVPVK